MRENIGKMHQPPTTLGLLPDTRSEPLRLYDIIWKDRFVDKIAEKHNVTTDEVEEVLFSGPQVRLSEKGRVKGENLYLAYGQTAAGRYLVVFFVRKRQTAALPITARDMTPSERRYYHEQEDSD
jgi:uncharacterized DUF497 family protein